MKVFGASWCSILVACLAVSASRVAVGDETSGETDSKGRNVFLDDRPDDSRGWIILTKASFWPLCYESMDRLEETRQLIGKAKPDELAVGFDKCGAWLALASSAAMTDGRSGVGDTAAMCAEAAESLRGGSTDWSDSQLLDLVVLGHLGMAKSHLLRAAAADEVGSTERASPIVSKNQSTEVRQAAKDIARAKVERAVAQYKYDTTQSLRHIQVAQMYLKAAAEAGGFEVDEDLLVKLDGVSDEAARHDLVIFVDSKMRPQIKNMLAAVDAKRKDIAARIGER